MMNNDGTGKHQITDGKDGIYLYPKISNDGKTIVFISIRSGAKELWRINSDGSGLTQVTKSLDDYVVNGKFLSDSSTLIGQSYNKNGYFLWKQNESGEKTVIAEKTGLGWDVSPDDKMLIYDKYNETTQQTELIVQTLDNNQILQKYPVEVNYVLRWFDNNSFVYESQKEGKIRLFRQTIDSKQPTLLYEINAQPNDRVLDFQLLPDGKKILIVKAKYITDAVTIKIEENK